MEKKYTSVFENSLIWFGAAVSIAEIHTGTYIAPLGFSRGLLAIIIGHIIGCAMLFSAGLIGGTMRKSAMDASKISFGEKGGLLFSILNVIQLVGWTGIMIYDGSLAASSIFPVSSIFWCIIIGLLIAAWIAVGLKNLGKINTAAMAALFVLTIVLSLVIFKDTSATFTGTDTISFGSAVELSVAMPLSWLPLISDYTKDAQNPFKATVAGTLTYGTVSCWMYVIGMGASIFTAESDIAQIMVKSGLGIAGLIIIVFSTVTTTFLDAYSAGISAESISKKLNSRYIALGTALVGTIAAMLLPLGNITDFLYFIGSVFAPMTAIQIADFFILKNKTVSSAFNAKNLTVWIIGFALYRILMKIDIPVGSTLPDMAVTAFLCIGVNKFFRNK